jgi:predicted CDP-diglyceride synthetase/phosphatidate cytidylyltransferase
MAKATAGTPGIERRPLQSRSSAWARWLAARLTATRITPNQISVLSVAAAALGGALLLWSPGWPAFIVAAACVGNLTRSRVKDWGRVIEGQGGVLDRMDSVSFASPLFLYLTRYYFAT